MRAAELPARAGVRPVAGYEIRVKLTTLLGLDDHPGQIPGSGPVHAFLARDIVTRQTRGHWRFVVTDDGGHPIDEGVTRARPTDSLRNAPPVVGATVEIAIPQTLLDRLLNKLNANPAEAKASAAEAEAWAPVIADIARRRRKRPPPGDDPRRRTPTAKLRRHVEIRDRGCVAPNCRMPAADCDLDHGIDYAKGGATTAENLHPLCRRHHRAKHVGGWIIKRLPDGGYRWRTPNGLIFTTRPDPIIIDLPPPLPRT